MRDLARRPGAVVAIGMVAAHLATGAAAQELPLSVVYGPDASTVEGDTDYREVIYLKVPAALTDRLHLRVFDADVGGAHDLVYGELADTLVRYTLFGGEGAATPPSASDPFDDQAIRAGTVIAERQLGESPAFDDRWQTLASFLPSDGEQVGDQRVFRLLIEGRAGNDANLLGVGLSLRERRNLRPEGLEMLAYAPTVRVPDDQRLTELRFTVPADADALLVRNFDAAGAQVAFTSTWRTVPLTASAQDEWREGEVALRADEPGTVAAITVSGGEEIPNDVTVAVLDGTGKPLPVQLPPHAWVANQRPSVAAEVALLSDCRAIAFDASATSDLDGDRLDHHWAFGDGGEASGPAVVHRYGGPGRHQATLRVTDSSGQVANGAVLTLPVLVERPPVAAAGDDLVVAPGVPVPFDGRGSIAGDRPIARHLWDFQDGTTAAGATVDHAFDAPGTHLVTLRVEADGEGPCLHAVDRRQVRVNAPPVAAPGGDQRAAIGEVVVLDGGVSFDPDGQIVAHRWDLGDGRIADGARQELSYDTPGTRVVTLAVTDDSGVANSTSQATLRVVVNQPPVAAAGPDLEVAQGEVITFDGSGSTDADGTLVGHRWDFGDGGGGRGVRVPYAYRVPGRHRVTLTVQDDSGTANDTASDSLSVVVNAPPIADAGVDQVVTSSEVRFDGSGSTDSDGAIARYEWDFGDGARGTGARPMHVYQKPGTYRVRLTVSDDSGTLRSDASDVAQVVINEAPIADAGPDLIGAPGQELTFAGTGSIDPDGDLTGFSWDFKDGATAAGDQVRHTFERPGVYRVRLMVEDDTGQPDAIAFDEAKVLINAPPVANAGPDLLAGPGDAVTFDAANTFDMDGEIATYRWDFSDLDEPQFGAQVVRAYDQPGIHTARLTVIDDSGAINAVAQDEVTIRINHAPVAAAGADVFSSTSTIVLDASQSADADGDALNYRWDFGDGSPTVGGPRVAHTYADGGSYPVILTVDDGTGLWNGRDTTAITVAIDRPPLADAGGNKAVCAGDIVVFDGSGSSDPEGGLLRYQWQFGDGTGADIVNPTKVYEQGAVYPVTLNVSDESGFPRNRHTDRIVVRVDESPIADAGPDQSVCAGSEVHFDGGGSRDFDGVVDRFAWNFGDGTVAGGEAPVHVFAEPGQYRVVLTITGDQAGQCDNSNADEMIVRVEAAPVARIDAPDQAALGATVVFDATSSTSASGELTEFRWDFGNGSSAEGPVVEHVFERPGRQVVSLAIEGEGAAGTCRTVTAQHPIVINAPPVADAGDDLLVAVDQEVLFDAAGSVDPDGGIVAYDWDFGDGNTASGVNVRHRYRASGRHPVTLTVTDDAGLPNSRASDAITVMVNDPPVPVIDGPEVACAGEVLALNGSGSSDADGGIVAHEWTFGDGAAAEGAAVSHSYQSAGIYDLALVVDDGTGLANGRQQLTRSLPVNRPPRAIAGPDRVVCPGEPIVLDGSASVDWDGELITHRWELGDGTVVEGARIEHGFEQPGVYEARLVVEDDSGSSCAIATDVARIVVNAPPVATAGGDREGLVGGAHDKLLFDASASIDADGQPLSFLWDLGDGVALAGEKVRYAYTEPGLYPVRLTVSDGSGLACGQATTEVEVAVRRRE